MTNSTLSRRRKEKEDRREAILAAAREIFFEQGIGRATVDAIAAKAEVAKGTVYLYFESKEAMLANLLLEGLEIVHNDLEAAYAAPAPSSEARLRHLANAYYAFYERDNDYFRLMMAFDRGQFREALSKDLYDTILHRSLGGLRWLVQVIEQGMVSGEFAAGDPRHTAGAVWAALNGVLVLISHPLRREILSADVMTLYHTVLDTVLKGLRHRESH